MREERIEVKSYTYKYIADDGERFNSKEQCEEYERTKMSVVKANYCRNVLKETIGDSLHCLFNSDDGFELYDIKDQRALDYLNQYLSKYGFTPFEDDYIGKRVVVYGYGDDVYDVFTREDLTELYMKNVNQMFEFEEEEE